MPAALPLSLLWPHGRGATASATLGEEAAADLDLAAVIRAIVGAAAPAGRVGAREHFTSQVLTQLLQDPDVIAHRQAVLADVLELPTLRERVADVLPALEAIGTPARGERYRPLAEPGLERVARRLADLELFVEVVGKLADTFAEVPVRSAGFRSVAASLGSMRDTPEFAALQRELPDLRARLASVRSVTIGVNLSPDLAPESATILEVASAPAEGRRTLLARLLGGGNGEHGLTPLQRGERGPLGSNELVRDLQHLLAHVVAPVDAALDRFNRVSTDGLSQLGAELAFLLGAAHLMQRLRDADLPVCRPECASVADRRAQLVDTYDVGLAVTQPSDAARIVTNDLCFDEGIGRVWVLTGPNRGGKTTFTRAAGLAQVLFQVGLLVPGRSARLSPVDAIHTHFPAREQSRPGLGRLDLEAERLAAIFRHATPHSLILLNEALSGTSALEALDLARGVVRGLRLLGARAIYVTHLHELAASVDDINASTPGDGTVGSLVADSIEDGVAGEAGAVSVRTYRIVASPPRGVSFAAEIAEQHGISYAQLARLLQERSSASRQP